MHTDLMQNDDRAARRVVMVEQSERWLDAIRCHRHLATRAWDRAASTETNSLGDGSPNADSSAWELISVDSPGRVPAILDRSPDAFVVWELTANTTDELLPQLLQMPRNYARVRSAVVVSDGFAGDLLPILASGVTLVVRQERDLASLLGVIERHFGELSD